MELKGLRELESLTATERNKYFEWIRFQCKKRNVKNQTNCLVLIILAKIASLLRKYKIEYEGLENISGDENFVFLCNHSNTHDFFTIRETFAKIKKRVTPLGAWDGLNPISRWLFCLGNVILIKRDSKESKELGIMDYCSKIINGDNGFVFGEATWNLHPVKPMLNVKAGVTEIGLITGKRIVPTIFEYVEVDELCEKESQLYKKCIVCFGKPVEVLSDKSLFQQTRELQYIMEKMRRDIWAREGIIRRDISTIDVRRYLNHTYLKKYKAFGFKYDSSLESQFLLKGQECVENEYCLDDTGKFGPGVIKE